MTMARLWRCSAWALAALVLAQQPAWSAPTRSKALIAEFKRLNPCPANGQPRGPCPGYQVDHREALVCGGTDTLDNLQWLTIEEHRAKTRVEVKLCRAR